MLRHRIRSKTRSTLAVIGAVCALVAGAAGCDTSPVRSQIVSLAQSQVGVQESPLGSNCNKYSLELHGTCREWCADFATWVWIKAGVPVTYGWGAGQLNSSSVSFYQYAVSKGTWHPANSGYVPQPGDAAVFGLNSTGTQSSHVAIVVSAGSPGVNAVNGNRNDAVTYSVNQTIGGGSPISGYASPAV
jgi:hypothetical protein